MGKLDPPSRNKGKQVAKIKTGIKAAAWSFVVSQRRTLDVDVRCRVTLILFLSSCAVCHVDRRDRSTGKCSFPWLFSRYTLPVLVQRAYRLAAGWTLSHQNKCPSMSLGASSIKRANT